MAPTHRFRGNAIVAAVACVALAGCGKAEQATPEQAAATASAAAAPLPPELEALNARCRTSSTGTILGLQALLSAHRHPALAGLRRMNLAQYCSCYFSGLQRAVGPERALAYSRDPEQMPDVQLVETANAADVVRLHCVAAVAPADGDNPFTTVFAAPFRTGRGLGGVELGIGVADLRQRLGETNLMTSGRVDKYRYGENGIELVVDVFPPGAGGRVAGVRVNRSYRGATDRGIRVGDSYAAVLALHADVVFREAGRLLLCAGGTKYFFGDDGMLDEIAVVTAEVDPLMKQYGGVAVSR
jgi:hypothetical protein